MGLLWRLGIHRRRLAQPIGVWRFVIVGFEDAFLSLGLSLVAYSQGFMSFMFGLGMATVSAASYSSKLD